MVSFDEMLVELQNLIKIESVEGEPKTGMPFGEGVYRALEYALALAEKWGFSTVNYDNYVGEAVYGEGAELAILCHLDVVPVGKLSNWTRPPFSAAVHDGVLYGRGAVDDKGPLVATLYAMKLLLDEGYKPKKKIKLIFGCNEESGWRCIEHYKKVAKLPEIGFSPDAEFPVIYAEKGILHAELSFDFDPSKLFSVEAGSAANVVCDSAILKAEINEAAARKFGLEIRDGEIVSLGKTAHGSQPENGVNAIRAAVCYLEEINAVNSAIRRFLFDDELKLKSIEDETGRLTMSPDIMKIENGKLVVTVDVRYPSTADFNAIKEKLESVAPMRIVHHQLPLYNDSESRLIQTLLGVYNRLSGKNAKPIAIGGGTYARALKLGAGFGPEEPDEPSPAHRPNESISLKKLKFLVDVYKAAIYELTKDGD